MKKVKKLHLAVLALVAMGSISIMSCDKGEGTTVPPENDIEMEEHEVLPIQLEESTQQALNSIFYSKNYNTLQENGYEPRTSHIINSEEELLQLAGNANIPEIDFENYTIIWGYDMVADGTFYVSHKNLFFENNSYVFRVVLDRGEAGHCAVTELVFYGVYPKIEGEVSLEIEGNPFSTDDLI